MFFFYFVEYLPDDGLEMPKHVGGLLCDSIEPGFGINISKTIILHRT